MDKLVDPYFEFFGDFLEREVPNAYRIYLRGRRYLEEGNVEMAKKCEALNYLLHNSAIPFDSVLGNNTRFAYGGIGVILHKDVEVGDHCTIGANVTLGAKRDFGRKKLNGDLTSTPLLEDCVYLSAGVKIVGAVVVGAFSIIGQNCVLTKSVPPFSVVVGVPGKVVDSITPENIHQYRSTFLPLRRLSDDEFNTMFMDYYSRFSKIL
ncbi:hypothetical protein HaloA020_35620 [Halomonas sp. A020]|uniref:hypothetical protein n=1 Tax=Halomonas sp. A020 TaxID=2717374 RepID=UPI0024914E9D|nr:hypothetical protein [Halomonas sp. A020]BCB62861.1 hypothetical protein HaloA020_35620 [Halomonas sp. A020]